MKSCCDRVARHRRMCFSMGFVAAAMGWAFIGPAHAADAVYIVRVEEDWKLVVATPEITSNSPQIVCAMSPSGGDESDYMAFELNHQSQPGYATGGLHLHAWDSDHLLGSVHSQSSVSMNHHQETVQWTQTMSLSDGLLTYEVVQGSSDTWGTFGAGELKVAVQTTLGNLNGYNVETSLSGSGVGFGANRVTSLELKTVRLVTSSGDVLEVSLNRDVLSTSEP